MRHAKRSAKLGRTTSHRRCMFANMLKALIYHEKIVTTVQKAKELRRFAEKLVSLAKEDSLANRRIAHADLMIQKNTLTPKQKRAVRSGDKSAFTMDREVVQKLFKILAPRFVNRKGGYTRISRLPLRRVGDCADTCVIEYLPA
jgi:large subunit ribosomal protein L17